MKNFLKRFIRFIKKSYSKPALIALLIIFLIGVFIAYNTTQNQKSSASQDYLKREQVLTEDFNNKINKFNNAIEKYNRDLAVYNSEKNLSPSEYFKKTGRIKNLYYDDVFKPVPPSSPIPLETQKTQDFLLNNFKRIENTPFLSLWKENFLNSNTTFGILFILILALPLLKMLALATLYSKKQITKQITIISQMTIFQKYLIIFVFCGLILLILILIKLFNN
ncbi:hypothetical protein KJ853_03860 [Patescibacteria group bacterium]|nr:hypothetical protein [Patescibacteria group bacterium]